MPAVLKSFNSAQKSQYLYSIRLFGGLRYYDKGTHCEKAASRLSPLLKYLIVTPVQSLLDDTLILSPS